MLDVPHRFKRDQNRPAPNGNPTASHEHAAATATQQQQNQNQQLEMSAPPPIELAPLGNVRSRCEAKHAEEYVKAWTQQLLEHKQALKDAGVDNTTTLCDRITLAGRVYPGESAA
ncbi:hypothetical protein THAOC_30130, partial [Thalassiosira oceanica]